MVDQLEGEEQMTVKVHMDDMKRVTIRQQDYFYHNISNTPFTLGIAFPSEYGKYRVSGGMELNSNNNKKRGFDPTATFGGDKWKLHPDWVYCEYNYAGSGEREFDSPETNMRHFLDKLTHNQMSWGNNQRVRPLPECENSGNTYQADCVKCDKELVQALVTDGEITKIFESDKPRKELFDLFGIELSFVATRSGLTRWEEHKEKDLFDMAEYEDMYDADNPREPHFSEVNNEAIDEVWYKRAVEYHYNNPNSFVFSVPFDIGDKRPTMVTATHAIFKEMDGMKAPAGVVGVQIDYDKFKDTFRQITTNHRDKKVADPISCEDEAIECYVLDNNGFVVISEDPLNTGKFFGEIDGTILRSLEEYRVFKKVKIYDYQAICLEREDDGSPAGIILTPFRLMAWMFNWIVGQIAMTIIRLEIHHLWNPDWTWAMPKPEDLDYTMDGSYMEGYDEYQEDYNEYDYNGEEGQTAEAVDQPQIEVTDTEDDDDEVTIEEKDPYDAFNEEIIKEYKTKDGGPIPLLEMTYINKTRPKPCDKEAYLYELNETALVTQTPLQGILRNCHESNCERPFSVTLIPNTNLVLVVADKNCPCYSTKVSVEPVKVEYGLKNETATNYCQLLKTNLYRNKPKKGFHYHPGEDEISLCGGGSTLSSSIFLAVLSLILLGGHRL